MNARTILLGVLLPVLLWGTTQAASVSWKPGTTPPAQWTINPASPGTSDLIKFSGPTEVHSNSCLAEAALGGTPQLSINPTTKVIQLWFQGPPPTMCPLIYMPVCGLEGEFGPLAPGEWTFMSLSKDLGLDMKFTVGAVATVYRVDAGAPGPVRDGTSWTRAFRTLQDALAVATGGDEIWVARGVYKPDRGAGVTPGDRAASFVLAEGLTIRGGFAGYGYADPDRRYLNPSETVLSGDLLGNDLWGILNLDDNSYHVVTGPAGGPPAVLDGLTVIAGHAVGSYLNHHGGGLYNPGGEIDIVNCTFQGNTAVWGGGIMNLGGTLRMVNTQVIGNRALMLGGGLYNYGGASTLHNGRIVGNSADYADVPAGRPSTTSTAP
jgi:hypothetical protein